MKKIRIVQAVLLVAVMAVMASCSSGRQYSNQERYGYRQPNVSLIIHSSPNMLVNRYPDGRYYYRNPHGYTYWRGNDNRYYIDRSHMNRGRYNRSQYNEWNNGQKNYYRKNRR